MARYACADLHGRMDLYEKILKFIEADDIVYFLGDACDRGPDGYQLIKEILNNPQWIYITGNHEDMFCKSALQAKRYIEENGYIDLYCDSIYLHRCNGGRSTLEAWIEDGMSLDIIQDLKDLPYQTCYIRPDGTTIYMNHSGFMCPNPEKISRKNAIWDRDQMEFYDCWSPRWPEDCYVVHGHTPVPFCDLNPLGDIKPLWYCDNRKIDIDMCAFYTDTTALLNLDTLDYHIIN